MIRNGCNLKAQVRHYVVKNKLIDKNLREMDYYDFSRYIVWDYQTIRYKATHRLIDMDLYRICNGHVVQHRFFKFE